MKNGKNAGGLVSRLDFPVHQRRAIPSEKLVRFLGRRQIETPYVVIDLDVIAERFCTMRRLLPNAAIYYAVKANPERKVVELLWKLGANFDAASVAEIRSCLSVGASPEQISYGNTIKKAWDIACAYELGVRMFSFDSLSELKKLAVYAPGSRVCCRLLIEAQGAEWPLSRKFGCELEMACDLLSYSQRLGLVPHGAIFHVGSQQTDPHLSGVSFWRARRATARISFTRNPVTNCHSS